MGDSIDGAAVCTTVAEAQAAEARKREAEAREAEAKAAEARAAAPRAAAEVEVAGNTLRNLQPRGKVHTTA